MCGIVGAVAERNVTPILIEGLQRLEYRGYDSAGVALVQADGEVQRRREVGKVVNLSNNVDAEPLTGSLGIAHTRWATHGSVQQTNTHPHMSGDDLALVHNGIIENYITLREELHKMMMGSNHPFMCFWGVGFLARLSWHPGDLMRLWWRVVPVWSTQLDPGDLEVK